MELPRIEPGIVTTDDALVDFYATVFAMERISVTESGSGTVHRLRVADSVIKLMIPAQNPTAAESVHPFFAMTGLRYLSIYLSEGLDELIVRFVAEGGRAQVGPMNIGPDQRVAILVDPDGNTVEVVERSGRAG